MRACTARNHAPTPGSPSGVLPHFRRRGCVGLGPAAAPPRKLGTDRERDGEQEQAPRVACPSHHDVEQELGTVPVLEDEVGEHHQREDVLGVGEIALDQRFRELRERIERGRHGRVTGEESGFDTRHRTRDDVEAARALAARDGALRERDRAVDVEREHRDVHGVGEEARRARSGSSASMSSAASTRICAPFSGPAR